MGSTWGGFLKPLKLDVVQYTAALWVSGISYQKKKTPLYFLM